MWANAQRDGRPVEYRWCGPLFNAAVWLTPTTRVPCSKAVKTQNPLKFAGVPQTSEPISAASGRNAMVNSRCFTLIKNTPGSQRFKHCICDRLAENYNSVNDDESE